MKQPYSCKPKKKEREAKWICIILLILAFTVFFLSDLFDYFRAAGQLSAVVLLFLFVQITTKFLLTEYEYVLEEDTLYLSSRQGKRIKNLGGIPISERCILQQRKKGEGKKNKLPVKKRFSYCQNLFPCNSYELLCYDGEGMISLIFEPDEILAAMLTERIEKKKKESKEEF